LLTLMTEAGSQEAAHSAFAVLLHPSSVPVVDVFRSKSELEFTHDLTLVQEAELELREWTSPALAKAVISDAILLAFSLSREREQPLDYRPQGSRLTSADERRLIALVSAFWISDAPEASVAAALGVPADGLASSAAANLASQIQQAGLLWPSLDILREPVVQSSPEDGSVSVPCGDDAAFKFKT
jgi:hypothetical protein